MSLIDLDAGSAVILSWLLTYAIHSTILLGVALIIALRFADEHAWLDLVWKAALLGPLVTASVQVGSGVIPLGGRWPIGIAAPMPAPMENARAVPPAPLIAAAPPERAVAPTSSAALHGERVEQPAAPPAISTGVWSQVAPTLPLAAVLSWLTIGVVMLVRFGARVLRLHRALASGPAVSSDDLRQMVVALTDAGDRAPIRLITSETCAVPLALPGRRIVLPERFHQQLDSEHQRAALAHETAHVIRRDPAWRILAGTLERAFFFQPLNRVARAKLCDSAEFLCDQWAVQQTRSPLALARCLSIVASWASPASDRSSAGASTMARGDSPIVRRVTRILNEPARPAWRPSAVWLAPPLAVVAMAAPLVTAAQLSHHPADAPLSSSPLAMAMNASSSSEQKQKEEPSSPRVWSASELAQARARLRVHRPPRPSDPLADRWRSALDDARRQGIGDFWIVYRFETPTHAQDLMMSDTREGTFVSSSGRLITQGPPLADLLIEHDEHADAGGSGNVTVLIHYGGPRADAIDRGGYRSTRLGFDFGRTPVFWLGSAPEVQSFERVQELFGQARNEKIQVLLIELASLHPTTDLVLPFLTRLLEPAHPVAVRREAAEGFDHHHDPRSVEILLRVARTDAVSEVRAEAAETIGEVQTPQSIPALTDLATNAADPAVRREAAEAFADQPPALALPAIEALIATSHENEVLVEAIEALGELSDSRVLPLLVRTATGHPNRAAQQEAVETLGDVESSDAVDALVRIVWEHQDVRIQREAVETLGDRSDIAVVAELERIVRDHPVEEVQAEAIETLGDGPDHRLDALILEVAISGKSARLRREALETIAHVASNTSDAATLDKAQQTIEHAIFNDPDRSVRMEALDALSGLPRERARRVLRDVETRHPDADVREEARQRRN
jgi:HEAT repeat protein/beta-lactamase regulating signal transducer with metallopeptidase domain